MSIELTQENQRTFPRVVDSGGYHNAAEVISAVLAGELPLRSGEAERDAAIERLRTFGKTHGLSLGGITLRQLRHGARP